MPDPYRSPKRLKETPVQKGQYLSKCHYTAQACYIMTLFLVISHMPRDPNGIGRGGGEKEIKETVQTLNIKTFRKCF